MENSADLEEIKEETITEYGKKEFVKNIFELIVFLTSLLSFVVNLTGFFAYLFDIPYFYIWNIDTIYYENNVFINQSIYFLCIGLICLLFIITASNKLNFLHCVTFLITLYLVGYPQYCAQEFNIFNFFALNIIGIIIYVIICKCSIFEKIRFTLNKCPNFTEVFSYVLTLFFAIFFVIVFLGIINAKGKLEYKKIESKNNQCEVILYSAVDYHIVSNCKEKDGVLYIDNTEQKKIASDNINFKMQTYKKVQSFYELSQER